MGDLSNQRWYPLRELFKIHMQERTVSSSLFVLEAKGIGDQMQASMILLIVHAYHHGEFQAIWKNVCLLYIYCYVVITLTVINQDNLHSSLQSRGKDGEGWMGGDLHVIRLPGKAIGQTTGIWSQE